MSAPSSSRGLIRVSSFSSSTCVPCENSASSTASAMQFESSTASAMQFESSHDQRSAESTPKQHQTGPTNVGELVAKAKKAAASLWMILHAQVRLNVGGCLFFRQCPSLDLLVLHLTKIQYHYPPLSCLGIMKSELSSAQGQVPAPRLRRYQAPPRARDGMPRRS